MRVLSVGEVLWDVFPDREILGGAPLNFCANVVRLGNSASLITGVGNDDRGRLATEAMATLGVDLEFLQVVPEMPTGTAVVSTSVSGEPAFEISRPAAFDAVSAGPEVLDRAARLRPDWLYFGTLSQTSPHVEEMTARLATLPGVRCFYDMNLRSGQWNLPLIERLSHKASVLKLNESEAQELGTFRGMTQDSFSLGVFCDSWARQYGIETICVTLGPAGCFVYEQGKTYSVPAYPTIVRDTVGAGDAFAAGFLHGYHRKWAMQKTARFANALGSIVASRPGATPRWAMDECVSLASIPAEPEHSETR